MEREGRVPWVFENSSSGCPESIGIILLEPAKLQALLPENFTVRDAGDFFDLPTQTGSGVLFFNAVECDQESSAEIGVYIHAPDVDSHDAADFDFYMLGYASSKSWLVENLTAVGSPAENGSFSAQVDAPASLAGLGSAEAQGESGMRYSFEAIGSAPQPFELVARFWQAVPTGMVVWQYDIPENEALAGTLSSCTFPSDSLLQQILGQQDCSGLETASLLFPQQSYDGEVRYLPEASAE